MSRNKRGSGADEFYSTHFFGQFANNTVAQREALIENMYRRVLTELAINRFKWSGLPESVDVRFLEKTLFYRALSVFYFDKRYDKFFSLQGGGHNWVNMEDNPVGFSVIGNHFVGLNVSAIRDTENARKAIPIWANVLRIPDLDIVRVYANKLAKLDRTVEINSDNARNTKFIASTENQNLTMVNIDRQITEGQNGIKVNSPLADLEFIKVLDLEVDPKGIETMDIVASRTWNKCMTLLGIENANQDKTERLVSDEVNANADQTSMMRFVNLNERQRAAHRINEYYGLDIKVEYYTDEERKALMGTNIDRSDDNDNLEG